MVHDLVWSDDAPEERVDPRGNSFERFMRHCPRCASSEYVTRRGFDRETEKVRNVARCLDCGWYRYQGMVCQLCLGKMVEAERIGEGNVYGPGGAESVKYECDDCGWSETLSMEPTGQV